MEGFCREATNRRSNTLYLEICMIDLLDDELLKTAAVHDVTSKIWMLPLLCLCVSLLSGYCNWPADDWLLSSSPLPAIPSAHPLTHAGGPHFLPRRLPLLLVSFVFCPFTIFPAFLLEKNECLLINTSRGHWISSLNGSTVCPPATALVFVFVCGGPQRLWAPWAVKSSNSLNKWLCGRRVFTFIPLTLFLTCQTPPHPLSCACVPLFEKSSPSDFVQIDSEYGVWVCVSVVRDVTMSKSNISQILFFWRKIFQEWMKLDRKCCACVLASVIVSLSISFSPASICGTGKCKVQCPVTKNVAPFIYS